MSTVKIKRSGTTTSTPSSLDHGELAINYADDTLFWKDSSNVIQSFVFQAYASATHKSTHATGGSDALSPSDIGAAPAASPAITGNATFSASSGVPVTITNTGTGNSFVVNDAAGDTTPFVVDASGNVGIWNSTPLAAIDASFASDSIPGSGFCGMRLHRSGSSTTAFGCGIMLTALDDKGGIIAADGAQNIRFFNYTGSSIAERVRIDSSGNLLVGTTTAASRLTVNGVITVAAGTAAAPALVASGDANTGAFFPAADTFAISPAGSERVRVDSSGRVGIGATPETTLHVASATGRATPTPTEIRIATTSAGSDWSTTDSWGRIGFYSADTSGNGPATQAAIEATSYNAAGSTSRLQLKMWNGTAMANCAEVKHTGAVRFIPRASDPADPEAGDVYYNSSTNKLRVYDGTSWVDLH